MEEMLTYRPEHNYLIFKFSNFMHSAVLLVNCEKIRKIVFENILCAENKGVTDAANHVMIENSLSLHNNMLEFWLEVSR